jgi:hypothetical protein
MSNIGKVLICMVFLMVTQCANESSATTETATTPTASSSATALSVKVKTGTNGLLGYGLEITSSRLTLLTTTGWIVRLNYDGTMYRESVTYSVAGCTGTPYVPGNVLYGKTLIYNGTNYYKPANSPNNQTGSSVSYNSSDGTSGCSNFTGTNTLATLTTSTGLTEAGLPATITGPIVLEAP